MWKKRIIEAISLIIPDMLRNVWVELDCLLDVCRATEGAHIEVY